LRQLDQADIHIFRHYEKCERVQMGLRIRQLRMQPPLPTAHLLLSLLIPYFSLQPASAFLETRPLIAGGVRS
jgi:hypothetical protein